MPFMKRALLYVFLLVFVTNIIGWQWLFVRIQNLHHEKEWSSMPARNEGEEIVSIRIAKEITGEAFQVNDHEIIYKGKLYDVTHVQKTTNESIYYGVEDQPEEDLIATFNVVIKNNISESASVHSKNTKPVKLALSDYMPSFSEGIIASP